MVPKQGDWQDMKVIYIAAPYSIGDKEENVRRAIDAADMVMNLGGAPVNPLLSHYHEQLFPRKYDEWMRVDFAILAKCDAVYRVSGESDGADAETTMAKMVHGIPVFRQDELGGLEGLINFLRR